MENPANRENTGRNPDGTFIAGVSGNPSGRPKGTLKEYVSRKFREMSDEEKEQWLAEHKIAGEVQWKMGEGNPTSELTGKDGKDLIPEDSPRIKELTEKLNAGDDIVSNIVVIDYYSATFINFIDSSLSRNPVKKTYLEYEKNFRQIACDVDVDIRTLDIIMHR